MTVLILNWVFPKISAIDNYINELHVNDLLLYLWWNNIFMYVDNAVILYN